LNSTNNRENWESKISYHTLEYALQKQRYNPPTVYEYLDQKRKRMVKELQKQIANLNARISDINPA
jgi:hypothetical protein